MKSRVNDFSHDNDLINEHLCQAVADNDIDRVKILIKSGADVAGNDNDPLRIAVYTFNTEMAKILIEAGADQKDRRCIDFSLKKNHLELFLLLTRDSPQWSKY